MPWHTKASLLFFFGLGIAVLALMALGSLDRSFSGLGDGSGGRSNTAGLFNEVFALLICSYFLVSAIAVLIAKTRASLVLIARVSHSLLIIAYLMVFFRGRGGSTFVSGMALVAVFALLFFSPWLALWSYVLRKSQ